MLDRNRVVGVANGCGLVGYRLSDPAPTRHKVRSSLRAFLPLKHPVIIRGEGHFLILEPELSRRDGGPGPVGLKVIVLTVANIRNPPCPAT